MIATIFFYVFAVILLTSAVMVVSARNPVHSVLFLILAFFNGTTLFLLAGAEFLALILVIVYVGAVAVLFMFVVMMLDVDISEVKGGLQRYAPLGTAIGLVLLIELAFVFWGYELAPGAVSLRMSPTPTNLNNTAAIGNLLYTRYIFLFETAGVILLVGMIGAIVLSLSDLPRDRRLQSIGKQNMRSPANTLVMVKAGLGAGTDELGILRPLADAPAVPAEAGEGEAAPAAGEH